MVKPPIVWGNLSFREEGVLTKKKKKKKMKKPKEMVTFWGNFCISIFLHFHLNTWFQSVFCCCFPKWFDLDVFDFSIEQLILDTKAGKQLS